MVLQMNNRFRPFGPQRIDSDGLLGGVTGLTVTSGATLFGSISHPASVSPPRCVRDPRSRSLSGVTETATDSRGRRWRPPP